MIYAQPQYHFWGVTLSEDKSFVVSFTKGEGNPENLSALVMLTAPQREGYVFSCLQAADGTTYTLDQFAQIPNGTVLTVVWNEQKAQ